MEAYLLPLLINFFNTFTISASGNLFDKSDYAPFKLCLITRGVELSDIVERDNSEYYNRLNYQWQQKPPFITPLAFILVRSEGNVVTVVSCGRKFNVHLMPKGGGHSLEKYSFGDSNSVVVDTRNLKTLKVSKSKKSARVGSGWLMGPLAYELWRVGEVILDVTICPTVGIAGSSTGGGYGFFSREFGLLGDNILSARIVTAAGTLVTANAKQNADLYWALRGGVGSNFGIITQLKFRTNPPAPSYFYARLTYDMDKFNQVFKAWQKWAHTLPKSITPFFSIGPAKIIISLVDSNADTPIYGEILRQLPEPATKYKDVLKYPELAAVLYRNESNERLLEEIVIDKFADFTKLNSNSPAKLYQKRKSFYVKKAIKSTQVRKLESALKGMPSTVSMYMECYGGAINEVLDNATAFVHREETRFNFVAQHKDYVVNSTSDVVGTLWVEQFYEITKHIFEHKETYQNYAEGDLEDYLERYFGSNLPRLVQVKQKYDPENYWRNPQSILTGSLT